MACVPARRGLCGRRVEGGGETPGTPGAPRPEDAPRPTRTRPCCRGGGAETPGVGASGSRRLKPPGGPLCSSHGPGRPWDSGLSRSSPGTKCCWETPRHPQAPLLALGPVTIPQSRDAAATMAETVAQLPLSGEEPGWATLAGPSLSALPRPPLPESLSVDSRGFSPPYCRSPGRNLSFPRCPPVTLTSDLLL